MHYSSDESGHKDTTRLKNEQCLEIEQASHVNTCFNGDINYGTLAHTSCDDDDKPNTTVGSYVLGNGKSPEHTEKEDLVKDRVKGATKLSELSFNQKIILFYLVMGNFLQKMAFALISPFYPQEAQAKGISTSLVGVVFSVYMFVSFLVSPIYGAFITKIGLLFMLLSGMFFGGACFILFGLLEFSPPGTPFFILSVLTRTLEALGFTAYSTVAYTIVSNQYTNMVSTIYGLLEAASSLGFMIGPALGGCLYQIGGFGTPFYVMGGATLLGAVVAILRPPTNLGDDTKTETTVTNWTLLRSGLVWVALVADFLNSFSNGFLDTNLALHAANDLGLSVVMIVVIFFIWSLVYIVGTPIGGYLADHKNLSIPLIIIGGFFCGVSLFLIGPSPFLPFIKKSVWLLVVSLIVNSIGFAALVVSTIKCLIIGAKELGLDESIETYGILSGLQNGFHCFGAFTGPLCAGFMVDNIGFALSSTIIGFLCFLVTIVSLLYFSMVRKWSLDKSAVVSFETEICSPDREVDSTNRED